MHTSIVRPGTLYLALTFLPFAAMGCSAEPAAEPHRETTSHLDDANGASGACGGANTQIVDTVPTTDLCSAGTASDVTGSPTGPWDWSCTGTDGTLAHCSALSTNIYVQSDERDEHGALLEFVYDGIFGKLPTDYVYYYWVDRYNPSAGIGCRAIVQAFILASPARAPAEAATSPDDPALTSYIEMLYRALIPTYPADNTGEIAGWRTSGQLTMDQLDAIFLDDSIFKGRCEEAGMQ